MAWQLKKLGQPKASLSLLLCGDVRSAALNKRFRKKQGPTDILSFPANLGKVKAGSNVFLGDLALNLPYAWRKRGRFADDFKQELAFLLVHGMAHLLGYHHDNQKQEKKMQRLKMQAFPLPVNMLAKLKIPKR